MEDNVHGKWERRAAIVFCALSVLALIFISFKYLFPIFLPFLIAFAVSSIVFPLAKRSAAKRTRGSQKLWAFLYLILIILALALVISFIFNRLIAEITELLTRLDASGEGIISSAGNIFDKLLELVSKVPFLRSFISIEGADEMLSQFIRNALLRVGESLTAFLGTVIKTAPSAFITVIIAIIACFYFSMDYERIISSIMSLFPSAVSNRLAPLKKKLKKIGKGYLRAYIIIFFITFAEIFFGLLILGRDYAFFLALLIAAIDLLPILGTGIVLIPWGIFMIISKNYFVGFGLLILYAAVTVIRQFIEPHFLGESLGLHPLLSLFCIFAGFKLFGFIGMILSPFAAILLRELLFGNERVKIPKSENNP